MWTIIASLLVFLLAFLKAFSVSDRNLSSREYVVYSFASFVLILLLWVMLVDCVSDIAKENGWALIPSFIEELYSPWERTLGMVLIGVLLPQIPITWLKYYSYPANLSQEQIRKWRAMMLVEVLQRNMLVLACLMLDFLFRWFE